MKSLKEKIKHNMHTALTLGYDHGSKDNRVCELIDFGYDHEFNVMDGKCSIKKSLDFSMVDWELQVDADAKHLEKICYEIR